MFEGGSPIRHPSESDHFRHNKQTYALAGVDLVTAQNVKERIKRIAAPTYGPEVLGGVGGFGADDVGYDPGRNSRGAERPGHDPPLSGY